MGDYYSGLTGGVSEDDLDEYETGDETQESEYGGLTGDPDTSITEYGGLLGYAFYNDAEDPPFHSSDEQVNEDSGIVDGGMTGDEETSIDGMAVNQLQDFLNDQANPTGIAIKWWFWGIAILLGLILLSDYAELAAAVMD